MPPRAPYENMRATITECIRDLGLERGYPPTIREIGDRLGIAYSTVMYWIRHLENEGVVLRDPGIARSVRLAVTQEVSHVPAPE